MDGCIKLSSEIYWHPKVVLRFNIENMGYRIADPIIQQVS